MNPLHRPTRAALAAICSALCLQGANMSNTIQAAPITTASLLQEMTGLDRLALFPDPPYKTVQFSSYDRRSVAPYAPGWYANSDGFGREPIPGFLATLEAPGADHVGRYLLAEVDGPGVICRTWTAQINGEVTVILDGQRPPLYQGSAADFLGRTYSALARQAGLVEAPVGDGFRQAEACYFPIPFARSLRVEWRGRLDQLHFYHLEVRRYPPNAQVNTFQLADLKRLQPQVAKTLAVLRAPDSRWEPPTPGDSQAFSITAEAAQRMELGRLDGPAVIQRVELKVEAEDLRRALRQVVLKGFFDGAPQPQIEAPIGDLFGAGPDINPFDSLPVTVRPDGTLVQRFPMPFRDSAVFVLDNYSGQDVQVTGVATVRPAPWQERRSMHFHAKWRVDHGLLAGGGNDSFDLPYLCARGRGVLTGIACQLLNPSPIPTAGGNWWGEGDEKVWVDEDTFPSLFGTGSEDYFNYAWSRPDLFSHAYCAQPLVTGPDQRGFISNIRWHILDPLPFQSSIDFYMELMHHTRTPGLSYARTVYFYATPNVRDDHIPITAADVTLGLELRMNWQPLARGAARGATFFPAEETLSGAPDNVRIIQGRMWSGGKLVQWNPRQEGESITFALPAPKAGRYQLVATCALTPDSGRFSARLDDGEELTPVVDLYTPHQTMLRNIFFTAGRQRAIELSAGEHTITITAHGKHDGSAGPHIGIDFFWLLPR